MTDEQKQKIQEARSHLAVALVQVHPSDDQIIVGHMRAAQAALDAALYPPRQEITRNDIERMKRDGYLGAGWVR